LPQKEQVYLACWLISIFFTIFLREAPYRVPYLPTIPTFLVRLACRDANRSQLWLHRGLDSSPAPTHGRGARQAAGASPGRRHCSAGYGTSAGRPARPARASPPPARPPWATSLSQAGGPAVPRGPSAATPGRMATDGGGWAAPPHPHSPSSCPAPTRKKEVPTAQARCQPSPSEVAGGGDGGGTEVGGSRRVLWPLVPGPRRRSEAPTAETGAGPRTARRAPCRGAGPGRCPPPDGEPGSGVPAGEVPPGRGRSGRSHAPRG